MPPPKPPPKFSFKKKQQSKQDDEPSLSMHFSASNSTNAEVLDSSTVLLQNRSSFHQTAAAGNYSITDCGGEKHSSELASSDSQARRSDDMRAKQSHDSYVFASFVAFTFFIAHRYFICIVTWHIVAKTYILPRFHFISTCSLCCLYIPNLLRTPYANVC